MRPFLFHRASSAPRGRRRVFSATAVALAVVVSAVLGQRGVDAQSAAPSMADFFKSRWIYQPSWSPDGRFIAYMQDDWARQNLWIAPADGGAPKQLSQSARFIGVPRGSSFGQAPIWSPDSSTVLYVQDGDLLQVDVASGRITNVTTTEESEGSPAFSPDGTRLAFTRGGKLVVLDRKTNATFDVEAPGVGIGGPIWSADGRRLAFSVGGSTRFTRIPAYVGSLIHFPFGQPGQRDVGIVDVSGSDRTIRWLARTERWEAVVGWMPDSQRILIERMSDDFKERWLLIAGATDDAVVEVLRERDERYLSFSRYMRVLPDGQILYTSESTQWDHLYKLDPATKKSLALTSGPFDVRDPVPGADGFVYYSSGEVHPGQPHVYRVQLAGGAPQRLTSHEGVHVNPAPRPGAAQVLYLRSDPTSVPDVYVQAIGANATPRRVSDSALPASVSQRWQKAQLIRYKGHDGLQVPAQLFLPSSFDKQKKYPAIVHTHQASSYQDAYLGPGPQKDNVAWYAWNQRLADSGYVVLNVDYRGSTGYGREHRSKNYRDMGIGDRLDAVSGVEHLRTLGYVDMDRIGVYGMSYGGHLTLQLITKHPTVFKAGIDIAGVADMQMVYDTAGRPPVVARLGTPERDPDTYKAASPLYSLDDLRAPVLILHGTDDPNVSILQSIQLIDALLERGKKFEFELYPGELHFFTRSRSWVDAFAKMEKFFAEHVVGAKGRL